MNTFNNNYGYDDRPGPDFQALGEECDRIREGSAKLTRRRKRRELLRSILITFVLGLLLGFLGIVYKDYKAKADYYQKHPVMIQETSEATPVAPEVPVPAEVPVPDASAPEPPAATQPEVKPENAAPEHGAPTANWRESSKPHDISPDLLIKYDENNVIMNFNDCAAVGASLRSDVITTSEADYGFELTVLDTDRVNVRIYNNTDEYVNAKAVYADLASGTYELSERADGEYMISGYKDCPNGLGNVTVVFTNDQILSMGVFKENDTLYAVNIQDKNVAIRTVDTRTNIKELLAGAGITEKDAVYTDPIYYPIVPANSSETTDTAYWLAKSAELVEPDWSDARKIETFYNYIIDNIAYDYWILGTDHHARGFYYNDFSGTYHISNTRVGVCEDFTQIMAIMCRAQGIPALNACTATHAVVVVYSKDYDRWIPIDTTADIIYSANDEDPSVWLCKDSPRYANFDRIKPITFDHVYIGNYKDMQNNGIPTTY